jgi:hypothetical protein
MTVCQIYNAQHVEAGMCSQNVVQRSLKVNSHVRMYAGTEGLAFQDSRTPTFPISHLFHLVRLGRTLLQAPLLKHDVTTRHTVFRFRSCATPQAELVTAPSIRHAAAVSTTVGAYCNIFGR